ncbi:MAG TPA: ABC transporter substrate-binding protein, partial [Candidatus Dormibacteraeota bacterium]|nr:ABC transporter substrate-binding protein [Candidatus Dormibacteraeota bacterium]
MFPIRRSSPFLALGATAAILFSACSGASGTPSPSVAASTEASPSPSAAAASPSPTAPFQAMVYPDPSKGGEVTCPSGSNPGKYNSLAYNGEFKAIKATDAKTVEFDLCAPDVAFLSKIAFDSFQINSASYLAAHVPDGSIVQKPNGAGPYMVKEWVKGDHITLVANPNYYGDKPKVGTVIVKWSTEAAARLVDLQSGNVDGIDNVGPTDFAKVSGDSTLKLFPREGLNVLYLGMNHDVKPWNDQKVRQAIAMGIDRSRIVKNFYPGGSTVADYFTPCGIPNGCVGDTWYPFDAAAAKKLLADAGYPNGFSTKLQFRDVVRSYFPQPQIIAQDIQQQLKQNLNIDAKIEIQESTTFLDNSDAGKLDGLFLLGWGVDYPDQTDFVDYHFAGGTKAFGTLYPDLVTAIKAAAQGTSDDARKPLYQTVNNLIKQDVPMVPIAHGGSAVAFKADVAGAHSSPLGDEEFASMSPSGRDQLVFEQGGEPGGIYCADESDGESLRVCHQFGAALYGFQTAGTAAQPALASACNPNSDFTV